MIIFIIHSTIRSIKHIEILYTSMLTSFLFVDDNCVEVKLTPNGFADEMMWSLSSCSGYGSVDGLPSAHQCCVPPGTYRLQCEDSYGDGWHGGYIEVDGERYCESFLDGTISRYYYITIQGTQTYNRK